MKTGTGTASLTAKLAALLLILCLLPCAALGDGEAPRAELADNLVETKHSIEIGGKQIDYTATTGTMALEMFVVMPPKAHLTLDSRMSGSR